MPETQSWLKSEFSRYYSEHEVRYPERYGAREYAFFFFDCAGMIRHTSFMSTRKLRDFLAYAGPKHAYYSSAFYERPAAQTMGQKNWLGAELIFDLDADHFPGTENMIREDMLAMVKGETRKVLDKFVLGDLAFDPKYVGVVFSGGRGYHIHINDPRVLELDSHCRKEISDYIGFIDGDIDILMEQKAVRGSGNFKGAYYRQMPKPDDPGWKGRVAQALTEYVDKLEAMPRKEAIKDIAKRMKTGEGAAAKVYDPLFSGRSGSRGADILRSRHSIDFLKEYETHLLCEELVPALMREEAGTIDAPVTKDVNRLIRLPNSLHGKTGLRVAPIKLEELKDFEPLRDAVAFGDAPVKIRGLKPDSIRMKGGHFSITDGTETEVPEYAAVYFAARGTAQIE